jgi:hypothetical protein
MKKNTEALSDASKGVGLEVNRQKTKYVFISHHQTTGQNNFISVGNKSSNCKYFGIMLTNQNCLHREIKRKF